MNRLQTLLSAALAAALLAAPAARAIPPQVVTYSGYLKTAAGAPVTTSATITFRLYTQSVGGATAWNETVSVTPSSDGWFSAVLGTTTPLPFASLSQDLYLSLQVNADPEIGQRARMTPGHAALTVDWSGVQGRPTSCGAGMFLTVDGATGNLVCQTPPAGGTATSVVATAPIAAATAGSQVTVSLAPCATGQVLQFGASGWSCATPAATFTPPACAAGQIMQYNGTAWTCIATPSGGGGGVTSVNPDLSSGLAVSPTTGSVVVSLRRDCLTGQILKWTPAGGWGCAADDNAGGTITNVTTSGGALTATGTTIRDIGLAAAGAASSGYLTALDWNAFNAKAPAPPGACLPGNVLTWSGTAFSCVSDLNSGGTVTSVSAAAGSPISVATGTSTPVIGIATASASTAGVITSADWSAFNGKVSAIAGGSRITVAGSSSLPSISLTNCALDGQILKYTVAGGWACTADANSGGTVVNVGATAPIVVTGTPTSAPVIGITQADGLGTAGFLSSADWSTFNAKQSRVTGTCAASQKVLGVNADGTVTCGTDADTTYLAGTGIALAGNTFSANFAGSTGNLGTAGTVARSDHLHPVTLQFSAADFGADIGAPTYATTTLTARGAWAWSVPANTSVRVTFQLPEGITSASAAKVRVVLTTNTVAGGAATVNIGAIAYANGGTNSNTWSSYNSYPITLTKSVTYVLTSPISTFMYSAAGAVATAAGDLVTVMVSNNASSVVDIQVLGAQVVFN